MPTGKNLKNSLQGFSSLQWRLKQFLQCGYPNKLIITINFKKNGKIYWT
jgi:hypothetical protein